MAGDGLHPGGAAGVDPLTPGPGAPAGPVSVGGGCTGGTPGSPPWDPPLAWAPGGAPGAAADPLGPACEVVAAGPDDSPGRPGTFPPGPSEWPHAAAPRPRATTTTAVGTAPPPPATILWRKRIVPPHTGTSSQCVTEGWHRSRGLPRSRT
ncbi:hypothetical protein GCM10010349_44440 [Streptomyces flavofungini]|nr:hypothetical protein GCM10010349_44440 [Streptomyces flavofungini]